jgi:uncharacterized protein YtpQ (UPF0354 family)
MKLAFRCLVLVGGCVLGWSQPSNLSPAAFTELYVEELRKAQPEFEADIEREMQVKITSPDGQAWTSFLNNAYESYEQAPETLDEVMDMYVSASVDTWSDAFSDLDRATIVPIIKDRPWLAESRHAMALGGLSLAEQVYEDLNSELVILYARDSPKNITYLSVEQLDSAGIDRSTLRSLACANLKRLLPGIERHGENGIYMFMAGGAYEASLLLLDSIWNDPGLKVDGEPVVAIPARDLLFVTGSRNKQGLQTLRKWVAEASRTSTYRLTSELFVRRDGQFQVFDGKSK